MCSGPPADLLLELGEGAIVVGGHRGVGENLSANAGLVYPSFRENTIKSFQRAAQLGVRFVEFDVQVTKDGVPVLWHDDDVVFGEPEDSTTCQVKDLTLPEFQDLCGSGGVGPFAPSSSYAPSLCGASDTASTYASSLCGDSPPSTPMSATSSMGGRRSRLLRAFRDKSTRQHMQRLAHWDCADDDGLPTLEAVFGSIPESVAFNIEIKMTTGDDVVRSPAAEIDRMLTAILAVVEDAAAAGQRRRIFFSSFDPDVCTELLARTTDYPVYFLSGCGLYEHADPRRTSIPAALEFAAAAQLSGVVIPASVLMANKWVVDEARQARLHVLTYGLENNDLDAVEEQGRLGVLAAIIDDVEAALAAQSAAVAALC